MTGVSDGTVDYQPAFKEQQTLINTGYSLKTGNHNGLAGALTNYTDYGKVPVYTVQLTKIVQPKVTVNVVPVDAAGDPIPNTTSTSFTNVPGTDITVPTVTGYTPTVTTETVPEPPIKTDANGKLIRPVEPELKVTYMPNTATQTVTVPTNKGNVNVPGITGTTGQTVSVTVPDKPGYTKDKTSVPATVNPNGTITVDNPDTTGKVTYTPENQSIKVNFVDQDGKTLGNGVKLTGVSDGTVDYQPAFKEQQTLINTGYSLKTGNHNGLAGALTNYTDYGKVPVYTVQLAKIVQPKVTVNVVPVDAAGDPIPNTTSTSFTNVPGTDITVPTVTGYTPTVTTETVPEPPIKTDANGKLIRPVEPELKVTYMPNTATSTVTISNNQGNPVSVSVTGTTGEKVPITVPNIPGYTANKQTVTGTVNPDGTITVDDPNGAGKVTYTPIDNGQGKGSSTDTDTQQDTGTDQPTGPLDTTTNPANPTDTTQPTAGPGSDIKSNGTQPGAAVNAQPGKTTKGESTGSQPGVAVKPKKKNVDSSPVSTQGKKSSPANNGEATALNDGEAVSGKSVAGSTSQVATGSANAAATSNSSNQATVQGQQAAAQSQGQAQVNVNNQGQNQSANKVQLPQTNESQSSVMATIGLGLLSLLSVFGLGKKRRKSDDQ